MDDQQRKDIGDICYITAQPSAALVRSADGARIQLSYTEFTLLSFFIDNINYPLSLDTLANKLWGMNHDKNPDSIRSQITHIRKKLNDIQPGFGNCCIRSSGRGFSSYLMNIDPVPDIDPHIGGEKKTAHYDRNTFSSLSAQQLYSLHSNCPLPDLIAARVNGYAEEAEAVCDQLSQYNNKAALVGMGGVGKSELAKAIAADSADMFSIRMWVSFSNTLQETIVSDNTFSIWGCNREDHLKDTDRQYFERKMRILKSIADRRVLIIVDGFDVTDDPDLDNLLSGEYAVLITTRNIPAAGNLPTFRISHFKEEEKQVALFQEKYKRNIAPEEMDDIRAMIRAWKGHTLGICILASMMRERRILPGEMRTLLYDKSGHAAGHSLTDIIQKNFNTIFAPDHFSELEWHIMQNLALVPESGIQIREFCNWIEIDDYSIIESLIDRSLVIHDSYSDSIHLHAIIVELILPMLTDSSCCIRLLTKLMQACDEAFNCTYLRKLALAEYIQTAYHRTAIWPEVQTEVGKRLGDMLRLLGKGVESAVYFKKLRSMTDCAASHVWFDSKISHGLLLGGCFEEGHQTALSGYRTFQELLPEQLDWETRRAGNWLLQRLCEYYRWTGDYAAAERFGKDGVALLSDQGKKASWDIGWTKYHLAYALLFQGKLSLCKQHLTDALALFEYVGSQYSYGFVLELMGMVSMAEGDYSEALTQTISAGKLIGRLLAPAHPDCGRNWLCQGNIYRTMGNEKEAQRCYKNSVTAFRGAHDQKADFVAELLDNNEIILDIWRVLFQFEHTQKQSSAAD